MGPSQLAEWLKFVIPLKKAVLIAGAPGVGKSEIVDQVARFLEMSLLIFHPVVGDPTDAKGMPWVFTDDNGERQALFVPFNELKMLIDAKKPLLCFLDDLGQAPPAVQAAWMQLLLARRINSHKISDHVVFIAATNRHQDKSGVTAVLEAVKSRFLGGIVNVDVSLDDWVKYAHKNGTPIELIAFIRMRPDLLDKFEPSRDMTNSPCPRTVTAVGELMRHNPPEYLQLEGYAGLVGEGFANELVGFLRVINKMPDPNLCIKKPDIAPVPDLQSDSAASVLFALSVALSKLSTVDNFDNVIKYALRLPVEYQTILVLDAVEMKKELADTQAFVKWASKNKNVF